MKNKRKNTVENIIDLVRWFEEYQPEDLEQIERILTGLRYIDKDIMESNLKKDIYKNTKSIKGKQLVQLLSGISANYFRMDLNNQYSQK